MPAVQSKPLSREAAEALRRAKIYEERHSPPLKFSPRLESMGPPSHEKAGSEKRPHIKVKVKIDPTKSSKDGNLIEMVLLVFKSGTEEDWVKFRKQMKNLFERQGNVNNPGAQKSMFENCLAGKAAEKFEAAYHKFFLENVDAENDEKEKYSDQALVDLAVNEVGKWVFTNWRKARQRQRRYMQRHLVLKTHPKGFFERIAAMNESFEYFPFEWETGPGNVWMTAS